MAALHWFYSLGTNPTVVRYRLEPDLHARLAASGLFPKLATVESVGAAGSPTPALLKLLGAPTGKWHAHLFATKELKAAGKGRSPFEHCVQQSPEWARQALEEGADADLLESRGISAIWTVVRRVLDTVKAGDVVFLESTSGFRPFSTGLLMAHSVLRALRPDVALLAVSYGELIRPSDSEPAPVCPIHDLTDTLSLPKWASAFDDLVRRFDGIQLSEMLERSTPDVSDQLRVMGANLDLGWPDQMIGPLRDLNTSMTKGTTGTPAEREAMRLLADSLGPLLSLLPEATEGTLDDARLKFRMTVANQLVGAGRLGDATRLLRELMVDGWLLKAAGGHPVANSGAPRIRSNAERALFRDPASQELWGRLGEIRNAVSHARSSDSHRVDADELRAAFDGDSGLHEAVAAWLSAADATAAPMAAVLTVKGRDSPRPEQLQAALKAWRAAQRADLRDRLQNLEIGGAFHTVELRDASGTPVSGTQADRIQKGISGANFVIMDGGFHIETIVAIASEAARQRAPCWAWHSTNDGLDLQPFFCVRSLP